MKLKGTKHEFDCVINQISYRILDKKENMDKSQ